MEETSPLSQLLPLWMSYSIPSQQESTLGSTDNYRPQDEVMDMVKEAAWVKHAAGEHLEGGNGSRLNVLTMNRALGELRNLDRNQG